jgi:hypothetical protein
MSARCSRLATALAAALGFLGLAACRTHDSLPEFDALARTSTAHTIVFEDGFSLYSPYDPIPTRQFLPLIEQQLVLDPVPKTLLQAAQLPREERELGALLRWQQRLPPVAHDVLVRRLAQSFVVFLLERDPAPTFRARVEHLAAASRAELRAQEPAWSAWLDELAATAPVDEPREP